MSGPSPTPFAGAPFIPGYFPFGATRFSNAELTSGSSVSSEAPPARNPRLASRLSPRLIAGWEQHGAVEVTRRAFEGRREGAGAKAMAHAGRRASKTEDAAILISSGGV